MRFLRPLHLIATVVGLLAFTGSAQATFSLTITGGATYSDSTSGSSLMGSLTNLTYGLNYNLSTTDLAQLSQISVNSFQLSNNTVNTQTYQVTITEDAFTNYIGGGSYLTASYLAIGSSGNSVNSTTTATPGVGGVVTTPNISPSTSPGTAFGGYAVFTRTPGTGMISITFNLSLQAFSGVFIENGSGGGATLTPTPAPATALMAAAGLPLLGLMRVLRRRKAELTA